MAPTAASAPSPRGQEGKRLIGGSREGRPGLRSGDTVLATGGTGQSPAAPVRVLLVDDEPEIRRVLRSLLARSSRMHPAFQEAPDGETALALMERESFDIIISDYRMRQLNGIDVLERAADLFPGSGRILITGYTELDIAVDAVNRGRVSGFVRKPWDSLKLLTLVESLAPLAAEAAPSPATGLAAPAPRPAAAAPSRAARDPKVELEEVERQLRQLRVKFGVGGISPEGFRQVTEELRRKRAQLEMEILGGRRAMHP